MYRLIIPMLAVKVPVHLHTGTFGVDEIFEWALGTGWYYQPVPKALHRYRVVTFILVPGGTTNWYL